MVRVTSYSDKIMKILVTGAKGFVGKNLCAQLHRTVRLVVMVN